MESHVRNYVLLIIVASIVMFTNLGGPPLWDRDEPRNAGCTAEMLQRGDWVVPVFNNELRTHKPVLLYWVMMCAYHVFGANEFAARFGSALAAVGTVLLTYDIGRRLYDVQTAIWAGVVLATTLMFGVAGRAATPDSLLIFCCTLSMAIFVRGTFSRTNEPDQELRFPRHWITVVAMYAAMGLGVLAKGPVGFVLPTAVIGMYLLIVTLPALPSPEARPTQREGEVNLCGYHRTDWWSWGRSLLRLFAPLHFLRTCWHMRPLTALASVSSVALPWYAWVTLRTDGAWTRGFLWEHNVGRAMQTSEGHAGPAILFYVVAILVGCFPWSILTIPLCLRIAHTRAHDVSRRERHALTLLVCWTGVFVALFSLAQTKLPSYVTPCYPALAILVGRFVHGWRRAALLDIERRWLQFGFGTMFTVGALLCVGLPLAAHRFLPGSEWLGVVGIVLMIGAVLCWNTQRQGKAEATTSGLAATAICFSVCMTALLPSEIGRHQESQQMLRLIRHNPGPVVAFGHLEPTWIFYGGRSIQEFAMHDRESMERVLHANPDALMITSGPRLNDAVEGLDVPYEIITSTEYFLRDRELLLVRFGRDGEMRLANERSERRE
jgi:4-amino-4-deoxy-L-arabinose transferase-like glycosyltransferase